MNALNVCVCWLLCHVLADGSSSKAPQPGLSTVWVSEQMNSRYHSHLHQPNDD